MAARVGLFGGTFDPVHKGHVSIVGSFLISGRIDELWVLPSPCPPHKDNSEITSYKHRRNMLELAFEQFDGVEICDVEKNLPQPAYTIRTIRYLKKKYPETIFYLCIGEDSLEEFHTWHKPDEIIEECELLVAGRPGSTKKNAEQTYVDQATFVNHEPVDISSTKLRAMIAGAGHRYQSWIPQRVQEYIIKHGLYTEDTNEAL
ncbi:MAG: nicotinate (nicotinamide) nucleotide adenylyltransferase [Balneolaceae bacterium]|nr:nicotinate (nicotinamide) nucleotide adenylyltransferase [Balneolaceae bacterium]